MLNRLRETLTALLTKLRGSETLQVQKKFGLIFSSLVFSSYVGANLVVSLIMPVMMETITNSKPKKLDESIDVSLGERLNYRDIRKAIIGRNIFNDEGKYPDETSDKDAKKDDASSRGFDKDAPCNPTSLKLTLLGTIFLENGQSLATVKEAGIEQADIYAVGDLVINNEQVQVVEIGRSRVVFNNEGKKECIEIAVDSKIAALRDVAGSPAGGDDKEEIVNLQASWVESELGDGFGKVIQSARLVPNTVDNRVNGFKIFAIKKETLLDKVGFQNGDVIVQVNSTVMEAEHGFALYQAFLDEKDITVRLLRNGTAPKTIKIQIK